MKITDLKGLKYESMEVYGGILDGAVAYEFSFDKIKFNEIQEYLELDGFEESEIIDILNQDISKFTFYDDEELVFYPKRYTEIYADIPIEQLTYIMNLIINQI